MGRALRLAVMGVPVGGGGSGVEWLVREEFTTAESAPLASPRTSEPGPGTLTLVQTDGTLEIIAGLLSVTAQTTPAWGDQGLISAAVGPVERKIGRALIVSRTTAANSWIALAPGGGALGSTAGIKGSGGVNYTRVIYSDTAEITSWDVTQPWAMVLESTGRYYFNYADGAWYLHWVSLWGTANDNAVYHSNYNATYTVDYIMVRDLPAPFDTAYGLASVNVATAVSGTSYTATANQIVDLTVTAPNPLANTCELRYRVASDTNYWTAYFDAAGAFKLDSVVDGVATSRINVAGAIAAGGTATIRVHVNGTKHNCFTLSGTTWTKRGAEINVSHQDAQTAVKPVAGTGWTLGALRSTPVTSGAYAELSNDLP